jgi:phospholipid/cholesterol/gamma-HCH transport system substrate-binding protein
MSALRHRRHAPPRDPLYAGVGVVALLALAFFLSLTHSIPFVGKGGRVVHADFQTARQVNPKTPVRVHGVEVGKVEAVEYDAARRVTEVAFRVTDDEVRLREDASAAVRWRTVLGGRMELALEPGSPSAPGLGDGRIPSSRTRIQTELEDVTRSLGGPAVAGTRTLLRELPKALEGRAAARAIDVLGPSLRPFGPAMRAVRGEHSGDLEALVSSGARMARGAERGRAALGAFVRGAQRTLRTTADRRAQIAATFERAPGALDSTARVARDIDATLPVLDGLVSELRPGARRLGPVLARAHPTVVKLRDVLRQSRPLVSSLRPAVDRLADASGIGRRLLASLDPTVRRLQNDLVPYLEREDEDVARPVYQLIGPTFSSLAAASGQYDDSGHLINFPVQPAENSLTFIPCSTFAADPTAAEKLRCDAVNQALDRLLGVQRKRGRR